MNSRIYLVIILLITALNFFPTINNEYSLDDSLYLSQLEHINSIADLPTIFDLQFSKVDYRPIASLSFALEKLLIGENSSQFSHLINLILYLLCISILFFFLKKLLKRDNVSLLITGMFALLPLHASLLGNIKNRDNLLSFLFGFIFYYSVLYLFKENNNYKKVIWGIIGIIACFLSIFSKLDGLMFILLIPLIFIVIDQKVNLKSILRLVFVGLISYKGFNFVYNIWVDKKTEIITDKSPELTSDPLIFTENPIINYPGFLNKLAYSIQTTFEYITFIFKPNNHFFYYGYDMLPVLPITHPKIIIEGFIILLIIGLAIFMIKKNKIFTFGIFFFFIAISYCINLYQPIAGIVADRYAFIASAGACIAMGAIIHQLIDYFQSKGKIQLSTDKLYIYIFLGITILYTPFNIIRSKEWKNYQTLLEADMPKLVDKSYEANRIAMTHYIDEAFETTDPINRKSFFEKGIFHAQSALKIYQENYLPYEGLTLAYFGLGNILEAKNSAYNTIAKFDTTLETTYRILNDVYLKENKIDSIEWSYYHLNKAVPNNNELILKYAEFTFKNGHPEKGLIFCDSILNIYPQQAGAFQAKSYLYFGLKDSLNGSIHAERAFELGIRDMLLLDASGYYWWPRDQKKYESLKKYLQ